MFFYIQVAEKSMSSSENHFVNILQIIYDGFQSDGSSLFMMTVGWMSCSLFLPYITQLYEVDEIPARKNELN